MPLQTEQFHRALHISVVNVEVVIGDVGQAGADRAVAGPFEHRPQADVVTVSGLELHTVQGGGHVQVAGQLLGQLSSPGILQRGSVEVLEPQTQGLADEYRVQGGQRAGGGDRAEPAGQLGCRADPAGQPGGVDFACRHGRERGGVLGILDDLAQVVREQRIGPGSRRATPAGSPAATTRRTRCESCPPRRPSAPGTDLPMPIPSPPTPKAAGGTPPATP